MQTVFCSHCGFVFARGTEEEIERARKESPHSACPGCGSTTGVAFGFSDMSQQDILAALHPNSQIVARPGEDSHALVERMMREVTGREAQPPSRERTKRWLIRIGLTMLVVGLISGGLTFYLTRALGRSVLFGFLGGFLAAAIADRVLSSPLD